MLLNAAISIADDAPLRRQIIRRDAQEFEITWNTEATPVLVFDIDSLAISLSNAFLPRAWMKTESR